MPSTGLGPDADRATEVAYRAGRISAFGDVIKAMSAQLSGPEPVSLKGAISAWMLAIKAMGEEDLAATRAA
jgi:hypothetical protein